MLAALWTSNAALAPDNYEAYVLCKAFGWTPSQLDAEDADTIELFLAIYNGETQYKNAVDKVRAEQSAAARGRK